MEEERPQKSHGEEESLSKARRLPSLAFPPVPSPCQTSSSYSTGLPVPPLAEGSSISVHREHNLAGQVSALNIRQRE